MEITIGRLSENEWNKYRENSKKGLNKVLLNEFLFLPYSEIIPHSKPFKISDRHNNWCL
jgi:hypothetical protein